MDDYLITRQDGCVWLTVRGYDYLIIDTSEPKPIDDQAIDALSMMCRNRDEFITISSLCINAALKENTDG